MTTLNLSRISISQEIIRLVPSRVALHYKAMPFALNGDRLAVCVPEGSDSGMCEQLQVILGKRLELHYGRAEEIEHAIREHYGIADEIISELSQESSRPAVFHESAENLEGNTDASITRLVNELILDALKAGATDIHLEPFQDRFVVRYRVDGILREARISEKIRSLSANIVSRIKIMARLDIGEKRLPQDGRIKVKSVGKELDLRVSVLPSMIGEAVVVRILGSVDLLGLEGLGFSDPSIQTIRQCLQKPHGIILLTGPTGSGKTTTLYSILKEMNTMDRKIITIEDPVEYLMTGVLQMQAKPQIGFSFAKALRSMLRHDPDVLMIGEIRDQETAEIAVRSALTGHLVFSTLHTNDAPSALTRLLEMGIPPYLVASAVELVIGQRLIRRLCTRCKASAIPAADRSVCENCQGSGYRGREAIEEILTVDEVVKQLVLKNSPTDLMREHMRKQGSLSLKDRGVEKVKKEITTLQEIQRVC